MSETLHQGGAGKAGFGSSLLGNRFGNTLRYSLMNIFILAGAVAIAWGGPLTYSGLLFSFFLIGYVDELFGDAANKEEMPPVWYCEAMLFLTLPLVILTTLIAFNVT